MNEDQLKARIQAFYAEQSLPPEKIRRISRAGRRRRIWPRMLSAAAGIAAVIAVAFWQISQNTSLAAIANEIAAVHRIQTDPGDEPMPFTISELQAELRLPVDIASIESDIAGRFDILDCRACQLDGNDAVRLQVRERETSRRGTLYIAGLTPRLAQMPDLIALEGVNVEFWNDGKRCFGFACDCDA